MTTPLIWQRPTLERTRANRGAYQDGQSYARGDSFSSGGTDYVVNVPLFSGSNGRTLAQEIADDIVAEVVGATVGPGPTETTLDNWTPGAPVVAGELVAQGGRLYRSLSDRTTGAVFDAAELAFWEEISAGGAGGAASVADWAAATSYAANEVVAESGKIYRALSAHTSGADFATDAALWEELSASTGAPGTSSLGGFVGSFTWKEAEDPANHMYAMNGQTLIGGVGTYTDLATKYPSWVVGIDIVLPDWSNRFLRNTGAGAALDEQAAGTALPTIPFGTSVNGDHAHSQQAYNSLSSAFTPGGQPLDYSPDSTYGGITSTNGNHDHTLNGGDPETRPTNVVMVLCVVADVPPVTAALAVQEAKFAHSRYAVGNLVPDAPLRKYNFLEADVSGGISYTPATGSYAIPAGVYLIEALYYGSGLGASEFYDFAWFDQNGVVLNSAYAVNGIEVFGGNSGIVVSSTFPDETGPTPATAIVKIPEGQTLQVETRGNNSLAGMSFNIQSTRSHERIIELTPSGFSAGGSAAGSLDALSDVDTTTVPPVAGNGLIFNGTNWAPGAGASGLHLLADWAPAVPVAANELVLQGGRLYRSLSARTTGAVFDAAELVFWEEVSADAGLATHTISDWVTGASYVVDEFVAESSRLYRAVNAHTASALFATDAAQWQELSASAPPLPHVAEDWAVSTPYIVDQIVVDNARVYRAISAHTSDATAFATDAALWEELSADAPLVGIAETWQPATVYLVDELAVDGDRLYRAISAHTSSAAFVTDAALWQELSPNVVTPHLVENWQPTTAYVGDEVVVNGVLIYRAIAAHTSGLTFAGDAGQWQELSPNFVLPHTAQNWAVATAYSANEIVVESDRIYRAISAHTSDAASFATDAALWQELSPQVAVSHTVQTWAPTTDYIVDEVVVESGKIYRAVSAHTSSALFVTDAALWQELSQGGPLLFETLADLPSATTVLVGVEAKIVNDPSMGGNNEGSYSAVGATIGANALAWIKG